jgi:type VI secretion system protein ImpH
MAGEDRTTSSGLDSFEQEPFALDFFQAVRRIECDNADLPRIGQSQHIAEDPVRFRQEASMTFAPASISGFKRGANGDPHQLIVRFFGLTGPGGPMPNFFTEFVRDRTKNSSDPTLEAFLDVFHHRMLSFFYRAWAASHLNVQFDRGIDADSGARFVGSLFGIGMASFRRRDAVPDVAKLHFSGRLSGQTRNAEGLEQTLGAFFDVPVRVEQFVGQWMEIPRENRCRLGETPETATLGSTLLVGSQFWDCQQKFRIVLGPLDLEQYVRLLPRGKSMEKLVAWVRNYVGDYLLWDVKLILKARQVPAAALNGTARLGWTTWLQSKPFTRDGEELIVQPWLS